MESSFKASEVEAELEISVEAREGALVVGLDLVDGAVDAGEGRRAAEEMY